MPQNQSQTGQAARPEAEDFFHPGSIADRVDAQLGVLTQGVVDCMVLATGAFPDLTEGAPPGPNAWPSVKPGTVPAWQAARSAELRDAARLSEASARLLAGYAKLRGQFSQNFTIRHTDGQRGNAKARKRDTMVTHSFSLPGKQAVAEDTTQTAADLTRGLAKVAEGLAQRRAAPQEEGESAKEKLLRIFGCTDGDDAPPKDDPTPSPRS